MKPKNKHSRKEDQVRVNEKIRIPEVRVIDTDGSQLGVMPTRRALEAAESKGLDLVEVSPKANPPVCKIMDYGKYKYEKSKQEKARRQNSTQISVKEVKFRPKTDTHDLEYKIRNIQKFLKNGDKIRVVVQFRGREIVHPDLGFTLLKKIIEILGDEIDVEQGPNHEGRSVAMLLAPSSKK